jgi:hypothetical protein
MPTAMGVRTMPQKKVKAMPLVTLARMASSTTGVRGHTPGCAHCHTTTPIPALIRLRHSSAA